MLATLLSLMEATKARDVVAPLPVLPGPIAGPIRVMTPNHKGEHDAEDFEVVEESGRRYLWAGLGIFLWLPA